MKMNDTVAHIVDLMFDNAEMTEEVTALRDEVMNNCQERYFDLVESGVSEDDAVAAVVESLKGMEDVIAQYRRKGRRAAAQQAAAEYTAGEEGEYGASDTLDVPDGEQHLVYAAGEIHQIDVRLVNEDVTLEASADGDYHVIWDAQDDPQITASVQNGELRVERRPGNWNDKNNRKNNVRVSVSGSNKDTRVVINGQEVHFDNSGRVMDDAVGSVSRIMEKMGLTIGRMFSGIRSGFGSGFGVTIKVPACAIPHVRLLTTSGDLDVTNVALADLNVVTTSGDVNVSLCEDESLSRVELRTTSGDIEVKAFADCLAIGSTSGDVEVEGQYAEVNVSTVSGDIDVRADVKNVTFRAISGDVDLQFDSEEISDVRGSTISGDIDIDLPDGIGAIAINTKTRSGDVTTRHHTTGVGPVVTGNVTSMSGDITIR